MNKTHRRLQGPHKEDQSGVITLINSWEEIQAVAHVMPLSVTSVPTVQ